MSVFEFSSQYRFLSNFWFSPFVYDGIVFKTVEHAYQAAKCVDDADIKKILDAETPGMAKRIGQTVQMRPYWDNIKLEFMLEFVRAKFQQNPDLMQKLKQTSGELVEGNYWGDVFWGVCKGKGQNHLGKILMQVREE